MGKKVKTRPTRIGSPPTTARAGAAWVQRAVYSKVVSGWMPSGFLPVKSTCKVYIRVRGGMRNVYGRGRKEANENVVAKGGEEA